MIVVTGGPGAGKTAVLEIMRKILCEHVTVIPEAASILFGGGFWRLKSDSARKSAQRAIFHVQREMQNLVLGESQWALALCDRGSLDGLAYWPGEAEEFYKELNTTAEKEFAKYAAVIHLRTPSSENGYNLKNPIRIETAEEAAQIDQRISEVWKTHPHYIEVNSSRDFMAKIYRSYMAIQKFIPEGCRANLEMENV